MWIVSCRVFKTNSHRQLETSMLTESITVMKMKQKQVDSICQKRDSFVSAVSRSHHDSRGEKGAHARHHDRHYHVSITRRTRVWYYVDVGL